MQAHQNVFNISHEDHRTYIYHNTKLTVEAPAVLVINQTPAGELHTIQTKSFGESIVILPGYLAIKIQRTLPNGEQLQETVLNRDPEQNTEAEEI